MNPTWYSMAGLSGLVFLGFITITVVGALIATNARRLTRAISGLALCFSGVAGLYYFLNSPFVALMELLIYVGAVCIAIVFAVMMAGTDAERQPPKRNVLTGVFSISAAVLLFWGLAALARKTDWKPAAVRVNDGALAEVGKSLLTTYSMVFELISIVLLVAIVGSLVLARAGRRK